MMMPTSGASDDVDMGAISSQSRGFQGSKVGFHGSFVPRNFGTLELWNLGTL
jgi:hypothetical protein